MFLNAVMSSSNGPPVDSCNSSMLTASFPQSVFYKAFNESSAERLDVSISTLMPKDEQARRAMTKIAVVFMGKRLILNMINMLC